VDIRADRAVWDHDAAAWRFPEGARRWQYASSENPVAALSTIEELRTDLSPDLLEAEELGPRVLGIGGLVRQRARPEFAAALHERLAQVFAPLALALAALPFLLTTDRSRVVYGTVAATLVVVSYEVLSRALTAMAATGYLPPVVGGWLVPVVFCGFGAWRLAVLDT
jgi:lipopolysaccharide export LptBFGC system permease protein LptF